MCCDIQCAATSVTSRNIPSCVRKQSFCSMNEWMNMNMNIINNKLYLISCKFGNEKPRSNSTERTRKNSKYYSSPSNIFPQHKNNENLLNGRKTHALQKWNSWWCNFMCDSKSNSDTHTLNAFYRYNILWLIRNREHFSNKKRNPLTRNLRWDVHSRPYLILRIFAEKSLQNPSYFDEHTKLLAWATLIGPPAIFSKLLLH